MGEWNFLGFLLQRDGYGYASLKTGEALRRVAGDECAVLGLEQEHSELWGAWNERSWWLPGKTVLFTVPDFLEVVDSTDGIVSFTMFETSRLPGYWPGLINQYSQACIVPSQWCAEVFWESGVRVPLHVAKLGVDPVDFPNMVARRLARAGKQPYTFMWSGTSDRRKSYDLAYRAFNRAFGSKNMDVRLLMHFRQMPNGLNGCRDANVKIVSGLHELKVLQLMLARADCFVYPARGEGWGSPPREAAATGLPAIATNWSGLAEEIEQWGLPLRVAGLAPADYGPDAWGDVGEWAVPDMDHLVELMRWCFEHQDEAMAYGARAADWLAANAGWERTARGVREVVVMG